MFGRSAVRFPTPSSRAFALVGMAAFFTGVVRAPLTGLRPSTEMTSNVTLLLPMLGGVLRGHARADPAPATPPIYELAAPTSRHAPPVNFRAHPD